MKNFLFLTVLFLTISCNHKTKKAEDPAVKKVEKSAVKKENTALLIVNYELKDMTLIYIHKSKQIKLKHCLC